MKVTFLEAKVPLTKTFTLENGELQKVGHPRILDYRSHEFEYETIEELRDLIVEHGAKGWCLLMGNLIRQLDWESRRGTTDPNAPTRLICLDLDGMKGISTPKQLMKVVGMGDVDYVAQYSASSGVVPDRGLSCHIFVLLDRPVAPPLLKQYLTLWNLTIPAIAADIQLTRTNNALRWPLDVSTCQNDKLIYIAPPILGPGVEDDFKGDRVTLVKRRKRTVTLGSVPSAELNKNGQEQILNTLRLAQGLTERPRTQFKSQGSVEYMSKPDKATLTGIRQERGFVYMNLNGGDSWGYYHPENNPEYIYNFKGEPNYRTAELLPEYWQEVKASVNEPKEDEHGNLYLAFRDFRTATYWNGIHYGKDRRLNMAQAKSETQLRSFLKQHGQPVGDFVPDWDVRYDPHDKRSINVEARSVNVYQPSLFEGLNMARVDRVPDIIQDVLGHVLGNDEAAFRHQLNWLACVLQFKERTQTCWVWHGIQGTGKGLMLHYILRPMIGNGNVVSKRMEELDSQFNGFLERCQLLFVDEAHMAAFKRSAVIDANVKNYVVEPMISVRHMFMAPYEVVNYLNLVFASNKGDPAIVDPHDRRFNVGSFQSRKLVITEAGVLALERAAWQFYCYLMAFPADRTLARTPLNNLAREQMIHIGRTTLDVALDALRAGDLQFFVEQKPSISPDQMSGLDRVPARSYNTLMEKVPTLENLTRDELFTVLNYVVGGMPPAPAKFTSVLKHHEMPMVTIRRGSETFRGILVNWRKQ